jgi:hypothetical protein
MIKLAALFLLALALGCQSPPVGLMQATPCVLVSPAGVPLHIADGGFLTTTTSP